MRRKLPVIALTETHLDNSISDSEILPNNYLVLFRRDRKSNGRLGGGVLIAVSDHNKPIPPESLHSESEFIVIDILFSNNRKITFGVFYRPPNSETKPLEVLQTALQEIGLRNDLILVGDFNLSAFDWQNTCTLNNSANYTLLLDIVYDNFLTPLVNSPTREENILDLVLVSAPDIVDNLTVEEPFSDHNAITFSIPCWPYERRKTNKVVYSYSKAD